MQPPEALETDLGIGVNADANPEREGGFECRSSKPCAVRLKIKEISAIVSQASAIGAPCLDTSGQAANLHVAERCVCIIIAL